MKSIADIKAELKLCKPEEPAALEAFLEEYKEDERAGVQALVKSAEKLREKYGRCEGSTSLL